ncbi:MAG: NFACT family protein [bacterium]
MDCFVIKAIVNELRSWLCPGLIKRVVLTDADTLWLNIKGKRAAWLVFSIKHPYTGLYGTSEHPPKTGFENTFGMALSKNVMGGELSEMRVGELDRVIKLDILPRKAGYNLERQILIAELIDCNANLVLIESGSHKILTSSNPSQDGERTILPGEEYRPLPSPSKLNPFEVTSSELEMLFSKEAPGADLSDFLVRHIMGLSPLMAQEIVFQSGLSDGFKGDSDLSFQRLWETMLVFFKRYGIYKIKPVVIIPNEPDDFPILSSFPIKSKKDFGVENVFSEMNEAAAFFFARVDWIRTFRGLKTDLENHIRRARKRYHRLLANLGEDMKMLGKAEELKHYGDLMMANIHLISKGILEITLPDLYHEGIKVTIPLDSAKNAVQNAQAYFKRYRKAKRGISVVEARMRETEELLSQLDKAEDSLRLIKDLDALRQIETNLSKILPRDRRIKHSVPSFMISGKERKKKKAFTGIRSFKIDDRWEVLVGKTDKANDRLTTELSRPEDVWLHVYDAPGSHVVLKNPRRLDDIPYEIIKKAAGVAAFFSRQRDEERVIVGYTRKKYVRKPKGMNPGKVLVQKQKTVTVKPSLNEVTPQ